MLLFYVSIVSVLLGGVLCANGEVNNGYPCIYRGRLTTEKNWYGFLANISIMRTGRINYEFSYPAKKCCQNILIYTENQVSILNARMNCWQKEALLPPQDSQILHLTPRFASSGCYIHNPNSVATYNCHGGHGFIDVSGETKIATYHIAVSNCESLEGLDLQYRIELVGHVGDCNDGYIPTTRDPSHYNTPRIGELNPSDKNKLEIIDQKTCVIEGSINTTAKWYGFLANITFNKGGGFRFKFSYLMTTLHKQYVILYSKEDVDKLNNKMGCYHKQHGVIEHGNEPDQVLDLGKKSSWNGCVSRNVTQGRGRLNMTCQGERRFDMPREVFIAISNCKAQYGIRMDYRFEIFGYQGNLCSTGVHNTTPNTFLYISSSVITILALYMQNIVCSLQLTPSRGSR